MPPLRVLTLFRNRKIVDTKFIVTGRHKHGDNVGSLFIITIRVRNRRGRIYATRQLFFPGGAPEKPAFRGVIRAA
jgi:hypothetical protein